MDRVPFDSDSYQRRVQDGPCFVCALLAGLPGYEHEIVFRDHEVVAFLSRYPTMKGYVLVAPCRHAEQVTGELSLGEHLRVQQIVYTVSEALKRILPTERVYILSLGSKQGNAHVHWHVAPLPPGVPYEEQEYHALMGEGQVLDMSPVEMAALGASIRDEIAQLPV